MDGNRRWARAAGLRSVSDGHRRGAGHLEDLLGWCSSRGIDHLSAYVLSADNIRKRGSAEVSLLFDLVADVLPGVVQRSQRWSLHLSGDLSLLPDRAAHALVQATDRTAGRSAHLTLAIGYDGRANIVEGIRAALRAGNSEIDSDAITDGLPGGPVKDIDLAIRTSGEQRLSGPDFNEDDFQSALDHYAAVQVAS